MFSFSFCYVPEQTEKIVYKKLSVRFSIRNPINSDNIPNTACRNAAPPRLQALIVPPLSNSSSHMWIQYVRRRVLPFLQESVWLGMVLFFSITMSFLPPWRLWPGIVGERAGKRGKNCYFILFGLFFILFCMSNTNITHHTPGQDPLFMPLGCLLWILPIIVTVGTAAPENWVHDPPKFCPSKDRQMPGLLMFLTFSHSGYGTITVFNPIQSKISDWQLSVF